MADVTRRSGTYLCFNGRFAGTDTFGRTEEEHVSRNTNTNTNAKTKTETTEHAGSWFQNKIGAQDSLPLVLELLRLK